MSPNSLPRTAMGYFRVTMICFSFACVVAAGTYFFVQHTADRLDRQADGIQRNNDNLRHTNDALRRTNGRLLIVNSKLATTNKKLQHTLELVTDNGNRGACSIRRALTTARSRTVLSLKAATTPTDKAKAQAAVDQYTQLIESQRTVPLDFNCDEVLK